MVQSWASRLVTVLPPPTIPLSLRTLLLSRFPPTTTTHSTTVQSHSLIGILQVAHWECSYLFVCTWKSFLLYGKILQLLLFALDPQIYGNFIRWAKSVNKVQVVNEQLHKWPKVSDFCCSTPFSSLPGNSSSISFIISAGQDRTKNW